MGKTWIAALLVLVMVAIAANAQTAKGSGLVLVPAESTPVDGAKMNAGHRFEACLTFKNIGKEPACGNGWFLKNLNLGASLHAPLYTTMPQILPGKKLTIRVPMELNYHSQPGFQQCTFRIVNVTSWDPLFREETDLHGYGVWVVVDAVVPETIENNTFLLYHWSRRYSSGGLFWYMPSLSFPREWSNGRDWQKAAERARR